MKIKKLYNSFEKCYYYLYYNSRKDVAFSSCEKRSLYYPLKTLDLKIKKEAIAILRNTKYLMITNDFILIVEPNNNFNNTLNYIIYNIKLDKSISYYKTKRLVQNNYYGYHYLFDKRIKYFKEIIDVFNNKKIIISHNNIELSSYFNFKLTRNQINNIIENNASKIIKNVFVDILVDTCKKMNMYIESGECYFFEFSKKDDIQAIKNEYQALILESQI